MLNILKNIVLSLIPKKMLSAQGNIQENSVLTTYFENIKVANDFDNDKMYW